jgi:hypothetical protein
MRTQKLKIIEAEKGSKEYQAEKKYIMETGR